MRRSGTGGDIIPGIINTAPVPVICMSGTVNEGDGLRRAVERRGTDSAKVHVKEEGAPRIGKGREGGREKASHGEKAFIK